MARITGLGGFFFKARDPKALADWYARHLGLPINDFGGAMFGEDEKRPGFTLWTPFKNETSYFQPSTKDFMVNFRVDNLSGMLDRLRSAGAQVDPTIQDYEYGRFGWFMDPEGNRVELWEPPAN
jgi:predicted enzyme related to lactoylglutathione lyase